MFHLNRPDVAAFLPLRGEVMLQFIWQHLTVIGLVSLVVLFVISFFFRTAWGHWHKGRGRSYKGLTAKEKEDLHQQM